MFYFLSVFWELGVIETTWLLPNVQKIKMADELSYYEILDINKDSSEKQVVINLCITFYFYFTMTTIIYIVLLLLLSNI